MNADIVAARGTGLQTTISLVMKRRSGRACFDWRIGKREMCALLCQNTRSSCPLETKMPQFHFPHLQWKSHKPVHGQDRRCDSRIASPSTTHPGSTEGGGIYSNTTGRHCCGQEFKTKSVLEAVEVSRTEKLSRSRASSVIPVGSERHDSCEQGWRRL